MSELKPCPCCDADKPFTRAIPEVGIPSGDSGYRVTIKCRDCGCTITRWALKKAWAIESAETAWNRRIQPANSRFADCHIWEPGDKLDTLSDKCDVLIKAADIKELMRPSNEPLTLDELRGMIGEPIYIVEIGLEHNNRWEILDRERPVDADLGDVNLCNGDCYATYNMGIAWLAYRRKPEGSESDA